MSTEPSHGPILVKFVRSADVISILSGVSKLQPPYFVKPDRSPSEREKEKCLISIRWSLVQSGIERKDIKIRNLSILVNNNRFGKVHSSIRFS